MKNKIINSEAIQKLKIGYPELYEELFKLPAFELILNEGLKEKRKYCTPLEALLWIAYDRKLSECNPLISDTFTVSSLIKDAWTNTSESGNFSSKRWKDFDEVTDRLNSPQLIAIYTKFNLLYRLRYMKRKALNQPRRSLKIKEGHAMTMPYLPAIY